MAALSHLCKSAESLRPPWLAGLPASVFNISWPGVPPDRMKVQLVRLERYRGAYV
jgi:hypothetical protein